MKIILATTMALGVIFTLGANSSARATVTQPVAPLSHQSGIILAHGHGGGHGGGHHGGGHWEGHHGGGWGHHGGGWGGYYDGGPGYYYDDEPYYYGDEPGLSIGPLHIF